MSCDETVLNSISPELYRNSLGFQKLDLNLKIVTT